MADDPLTYMYGMFNAHRKNHPAGLPLSKYQPSNAPNQGASTVKAPEGGWTAWYRNQGQPATPATPAPATPATPAQPATPQTGGGTPNPNNGMQPNAGFASRYTPAMLDQAYESPWYILRDVFNGVSEASPLYQALRDLGGDPLTLFNIAQGSQGMNTGGAGDFVNWLANMYQNQGTVGGTDFNAQQLLNALFGQEKFGAEAGNTLGQILGAGDMSTQVRTLYNMARDVSNVAMNPLAARGYQAALAQAGDRYGQTMMQTGGEDEGPQNPSAWIAERMPWLALR